MYFDPLYLVFALPGLVLALWAQASVQGAFQKYAQMPTVTGATGQDAAQTLIRQHAPPGAQLQVVRTPGFLTDHYDPRTKTLALSEASLQNSVASVAVVAHEMGHALQDAQGYAPLRLRGSIVPAVQVGSWVGPLLFIGGMLFGSPQLAWLGVAAFALSALFALVTLPVEFDASKRALTMLEESRLLTRDELPGARKVLNAAAMTYVAAATQSLLTLFYYVHLLAGGRRREA